MQTKIIIKQGTSLLLVALLAACATKSDVKTDGTTDHPVFPPVNEVSFSFKHQKGTFPTADELAQIKAGMTKDQLYKLIGRPHFDEGMFNVREWDYVFHFHTPGQGKDNVTTCQFKILFDSNKYARSFHWKAVDPQNATCPASASVEVMPQRYTLSADALFDFDQSDIDHIRVEGKEELDELADKLKTVSYKRINVIGHTDHLGAEDYNQILSKQRADAVREYLSSRGVDKDRIRTRGAGESQPVNQCMKNMDRQALIACLAPNRRVEIEVEATS